MKQRVLFGMVWLLLAGGGGEAQDQRGAIDFLSERLFIPDSERFREADYIESGVGLKFGVDKRLSYMTGNYEDAVRHFEEAVRQFRYKSEIWVFLARSYFYMQSPEKAGEIIAQAALVMPDLQERFWNPLLESMLGEIRKRAHSLQTQVDFYSKTQEDFLSLFRLYKFLADYSGAAGVIRAAQAKADRMEELATMVSGESQRRYRKDAQKWLTLADKLRDELRALGIEVPSEKHPEPLQVLPISGKDPELVEATRILQLKTDYYQSEPKDYRTLFDNYLQLGLPDRAALVIASLDREIQRVKLQADIAPSLQQEGLFLDEKASLETLREELKGILERQTSDGSVERQTSDGSE